MAEPTAKEQESWEASLLDEHLQEHYTESEKLAEAVNAEKLNAEKLMLQAKAAEKAEKFAKGGIVSGSLPPLPQKHWTELSHATIAPPHHKHGVDFGPGSTVIIADKYGNTKHLGVLVDVQMKQHIDYTVPSQYGHLHAVPTGYEYQLTVKA